MNVVEALNRQNPKKWSVVSNGQGPFDGGLYCNNAVNLVLSDSLGNTETFSFAEKVFIPLHIEQVVSGATGNDVIGFSKG